MRKRRKILKMDELTNDIRWSAHSFKYQDKQMELIDELRAQGYSDKAIGKAVKELARRQIDEYNACCSRMSDDTIVEFLNNLRQEN